MTQEMVQYYAERAREYDNIYEQPGWQSDIETLKQLIPTFFAGRRVFEIACGTGYWTQYAAQQAVSIYATDVNEATLAVARSRTYTTAQVTFHCADAYTSSGELETFNAGLAAFWLSHVDLHKMGNFLASFHAYLEKDALVLLFDERLTLTRWLSASRTDMVGNRFEMRQLSAGARFEIIKNFYKVSQLREWFSDYGYDFSYKKLKYFWVCSYKVR
jgi:ubiquinone/menaquinone biosynthesis C-methylase UbiE